MTEEINDAALGREPDRETGAKASAPAAQPPLQTGSKLMTVLLMLLGLFAFWQSLRLYERDGSLAGFATIPLALSVLLFLLSGIDLIKNRKVAGVDKSLSPGQRVKQVLAHVCPLDTVIVVALIIAYVVALKLGLGFIPASLIFLMLAMCYMLRGHILRNLIVSVITVGVIYVIFKICFKIFLP